MRNKKNKYVKVREVMPGLYEIGANAVQCHLFVGEHHALLVDTGYGLINLPAVVRGITKLPLYIVNSHGHADHACGNSQFGQCVYIHPDDLEVFSRHNSPEYRKMMLGALQGLQKLLFFLHIVPPGIDAEQYLQDDFSDFLPVREGDVFELGGMTIRVVDLPGHTPGSIGLLCDKLRVLITSDAINSNVYMFLPESTKLSVYKQSLYKARELDFDFFITGHQPKLLPKSELDAYIETAEHADFEKGIKQQENGLTPGVELRRCIHPSMKKHKAPGIMICRDKFD